MKTPCAFAPVNIALIKYMGKENGKPLNSSFSLTLQSLGTKTKVTRGKDAPELKVIWSRDGYVPPTTGKEKVEKFLKNEAIWRDLVLGNGFTLLPQAAEYEVKTINTVPAGTGIATSASGYAALAMAYALARVVEKDKWREEIARPGSPLKIKLAQTALYGSGSACRSFHGPGVEWRTSGDIHPFEITEDLTDIVLLIDSEEKKVSSSDAHKRVKTSHLFKERAARVENRLDLLKKVIRSDDSIFKLKSMVLEEALEMHELFHTSDPPFSYLKPKSKEWIDRIKNHVDGVPSSSVFITLDAGANVHLIIPTHEEDRWMAYIHKVDPKLAFEKSITGRGAVYRDDEGF